MKKEEVSKKDNLMVFLWIIIIAMLIIGVVVRLGIFGRDKLFPDSCEFSDGFECVKSVDLDVAHEEILFDIKNRVGSPVNMTSFIGMTGGCSSYAISQIKGMDFSDGAIRLEDGEEGLMVIACKGLKKGSSYSDIYLKYVNLDTGLEHIVKVRIRGISVSSD